uniref:non-specific serine/threonine protein kinase n=1 Tax=Cryptomonas curvata TaxID=233186 RepID=A0A7S0M168_9CRYP
MTALENVLPILREIRVCSIEQPDLQHEGLCGISLACHAAAVEVHLPGFGRLGLRGRLPFVALEYCEGLDLYEFGENGKGIPAMSNGLKRKVEEFLAVAHEGPGAQQGDLPDVDILMVNKLLQDIAVHKSESLSLLKMCYDILVSSSAVTFDAFQGAWSDKYDADVGRDSTRRVPPQTKACSALRRLLELVHDWEWDSAVQFLAAPQFVFLWEKGVVPQPSEPRMQEQLLKLLKVEQKQREINCQLYGRLGKVLLNDPLCRRRIFDPSRERNYAMRARLSEPSSQGREEDCRKAAAALLLENELSLHLLSDVKRRLALCSSEVSGALPPAAAWAIFLQATKAVAKLHESGIAHGDIKSENFVLTVGGRVKLIDFGFMHELSMLNPATLNKADFAYAPYVSPEFRRMQDEEGFLEKLIEKTGMTAAQLFKANDVWMLGQMLYFLLLRAGSQRTAGHSLFFAEKRDWLSVDTWEAHSPDSDEASEKLESLGLPAEQTGALCSLLLKRIFVPAKERVGDAGQVVTALAELGVADLAISGQGDLLHLAWPYFIPRPTLPAKKAGGSTRAAIFEADLDFVQVLQDGKPGHWRVFRVGEGLQAEIQRGFVGGLQVNDRILKIDGKSPSAGPPQRSGPFYSEMEAQVERDGGGAAVAVVLRRTRPVYRERVASDPERFRSYLVESGFLAQAMATSMVVDRQALRRAFTRWQQQYRCEMDFNNLLLAWSRRGWTVPSPTLSYTERMRQLST